jgi:hypothetical protein
MTFNAIRWSGLAALLGGTSVMVYSVITASMPRGCIGDVECASRQMRDTGSVDAFLMLGFLLVAAGAVGLVFRLREARRLGWLGRASVIFGAIGFALAVLAAITAAMTGGMSPLMPYFVVPGLLAIIVGFLLLAIAVLLARVLSLPTALVLIASLLAMFGFNDQNWRVLLAVPFGVAWVAVGYALWSRKKASGRRPAQAEGAPSKKLEGRYP